MLSIRFTFDYVDTPLLAKSIVSGAYVNEQRVATKLAESAPDYFLKCKYGRDD